MEAATGHPLQAFADLITIEEYKRTERPKVVLTWAPHPRALPQAVPNSFADFMNEADVDFVITHPQAMNSIRNSCVEQRWSTIRRKLLKVRTLFMRRIGLARV